MLMLAMPLTPMVSKVDASGARSVACSSTICINELMPNPAGLDTGTYPDGEWVELYNSGSTDLNLQGWKLEDIIGWKHNIDSNTWVGFANLAVPYVLPAGDYAIIAENNQGSLKLNNAGETLYLIDDFAITVHTVTTGTATSDISKIPGATATDDYVDSASNTPGAANGGAGTGPTYTQSDLRITEVMPDPYWTGDNDTWPGGEWVEITNVGSVAVDLTDWLLKDAAGNEMVMNETYLVGFLASTIIAAGEHRIVAVNGTRTYGLLNNGAGQETVQLIMPNGDITHEVSYAGPTKVGHSYVNASGAIPEWGDNQDLLTTAMWPTPAEMNPSGAILPADWQINEVMVNSTDDSLPAPDGEWIEIHMPAVDDGQASSMLLTNYHIMTGTGVEIPFDCTTLTDCADGDSQGGQGQGWPWLGEGQFRMLELHNLSGYLLDTYDSIALVDFNGDVSQFIQWTGSMQENNTICPSDYEMMHGPWQYCDYSTPGEANPGQESGGVIEDAQLRISEILPNPAGNDSQSEPFDEWVEIVNVGNDTVELAGWRLVTAAGLTLPAHQLYPNDRYVVHLASSSNFWLTNSYGTLKLQNPLGEVVHTVVWDFSSPGMSLVANTSDSDPWVMSPWPTPGAANPAFDNPYTGPVDIEISELMPQCSTNEDGLTTEWLEFHYNGTGSVNLSRWMVVDENGYSVAVRYGRMWNRTDNSTILESGEYEVLLIDDSVLSNYDETVSLLSPNREIVQTLTWSESSNCDSLAPDDDNAGEVMETLWPTPGEENPVPQSYDSSMTVKFTRLMPGEITGRENDWFELTNVGETFVDMTGWRIARMRTAGLWNSTFGSVTLQPGQSIVFSSSPENLLEDGGIVAMNSDTVFGGNAPWLVNSGGSLQLVAPDGTNVDAFVYAAGDADIQGWIGGSLELPPTDFSGLILMRGDGCGSLPDTDSAADWSIRWLRLGASLFCDDGIFSTTGSLTPMFSPNGGLHQLISWIGQAQDTIHVHVYQFSSPEIYQALADAVSRGVECTVLLEGGILGETSSLDNQRGWASELSSAGCQVLWMTEPEGANAAQSPYRYIHSKVAVADGDSVWIDSGNLKRSTFPLDADMGNRDWGIIIESEDVADLVLSRMLWDESSQRNHVIAQDDFHPTLGRPTGWTPDSSSTAYSALPIPPTTETGAFSGRLLTCPDDCIGGLIWMIDEADSSIDLSLQYFDLGWHWGYGDNPLIEAIERAASERDVKVRLVINGYYILEDEDIRETVNYFNHELNMTQGLDVTAIIMAPSNDITKLHNKGAIVDGELTLISSINWGSNSALRNREMGIIIEHTGLAAQFGQSWNEDWERLDNTTDTDGDGMPDWWELAFGTNRTWSIVAGSPELEDSLDPDADGLSNLREFQGGGNPFDEDTDDDCIIDGLEAVWAGYIGVNLMTAVISTDADGDGVNDGEQTNCGADLSGMGDSGGGGDDNGSGGGNEDGGPFRDNALDSVSAQILLVMMILAAVLLGGAATIMLLSRRRAAAGTILVDDTSFDLSDHAWREGEQQPGIPPDSAHPTTPTSDPEGVGAGVEAGSGSGAGGGSVILDGTSVGPNAGSEVRELTQGKDDGAFGAPQLDGYDFPNWSPKQVQDSIAAGWTVDQLREHYDKEQH